MKIAFVSTMASVPWGGSEILWSESAYHLVKAGHRVFVGYPKWPTTPKPLKILKDDLGIPVYEYPRNLGGLRDVIERIKGKIGLKFIDTKRQKWLRTIKPDLLCISGGNATEVQPWMIIARREKIPFVTIAQAHAEFLWPTDQQADVLIELFSAAERCYFVSNGNLHLLENQLGCTLANAEVIRNHSAKQANESLDWPQHNDDIVRWACVARLHPASKGQDLLIDVLRQPQWRERPVIVSLYGDGPQKRSLSRLVEKYGLQDKIRFCGHVSDIQQVWRENHLLILPSRYEGLPLALVEALMLGRPAIVTDVAGNAEVLEHGVTGFVAEGPSVRSLAKVMEEAWFAKDKWKEMGQRAQRLTYQNLPADPGQVLSEKLLGFNV